MPMAKSNEGRLFLRFERHDGTGCYHAYRLGKPYAIDSNLTHVEFIAQTCDGLPKRSYGINISYFEKQGTIIWLEENQ